MLRFVDVRFQGLQARFALWDTVIDEFISLDGTQAWTTLADFENDLGGFPALSHRILERVRRLCPDWVNQPATDEELDFRDERLDTSFSVTGW